MCGLTCQRSLAAAYALIYLPAFHLTLDEHYFQARLTMADSEGRRSIQAERKLEDAAPSDPTVQPDQHSAGLHPAFYIAYRTSLHDVTKADANTIAVYGSH